MSDLDAVADELYSLPPADFVAARDARVRAAKEAKDADLARAIGQLRKPTVAAWVLNLLVRRHPDDVDRLLELGEALREAQSSLSGPQLRELGRARHDVLAALGDRARALAAEAGHRVGAAVEEDVQQTLGAALADPAAADRLRTGRLTSSIAYEGFGPAVAGAATPRPREDQATRRRAAEAEKLRLDRQRLRAARREAAAAVADAERRAVEARHLADEAEQKLARARTALENIDRQLGD